MPRGAIANFKGRKFKVRYVVTGMGRGRSCIPHRLSSAHAIHKNPYYTFIQNVAIFI